MPVTLERIWGLLTEAEKAEFIGWVTETEGTQRGSAPGVWLFKKTFCVITYGSWEENQ